jgi:hypothetical protein|tara:strand:- start:20 stop:145 length:126 start_codon:yes stop_codon:yes gene_type:complete
MYLEEVNIFIGCMVVIMLLVAVAILIAEMRDSDDDYDETTY